MVSAREIQAEKIKMIAMASDEPGRRSAGFQTCRIADFPIGQSRDGARLAGLETCGTADLEVCATIDARRITSIRILSLRCRFGCGQICPVQSLLPG